MNESTSTGEAHTTLELRRVITTGLWINYLRWCNWASNQTT